MKVSPSVQDVVEAQMWEDDETTTVQLCAILSRRARILSLNCLAQPDCPWMDLPQQLLLPNDPGTEQAEVFRVGVDICA